MALSKGNKEQLRSSTILLKTWNFYCWISIGDSNDMLVDALIAGVREKHVQERLLDKGGDGGSEGATISTFSGSPVLSTPKEWTISYHMRQSSKAFG